MSLQSLSSKIYAFKRILISVRTLPKAQKTKNAPPPMVVLPFGPPIWSSATVKNSESVAYIKYFKNPHWRPAAAAASPLFRVFCLDPSDQTFNLCPCLKISRSLFPRGAFRLTFTDTTIMSCSCCSSEKIHKAQSPSRSRRASCRCSLRWSPTQAARSSN